MTCHINRDAALWHPFFNYRFHTFTNTVRAVVPNWHVPSVGFSAAADRQRRACRAATVEFRRLEQTDVSSRMKPKELNAEYAALIKTANTHHQARRHVECEAALRRALVINPSNDSALHVLALTRYALGDKTEAIELMHKALALAPSSAVYLRDLGMMLCSAGRFEEALAACRRALEISPADAVIHNGIGGVLTALGRPAEAIPAFRCAVELKPEYAEAYSNLGHALHAVGHPAQAEAACRRAIALAPAMPAAHVNLGLALQDAGRLDEALASFRQAGALDPGYAMAMVCEGALLLLRGELDAGWEKYEARWHTGDLPPRDFTQPQWHGEPLAGKTILLNAEQGFGDSIQFLRYVPLVVARGGTVILEIQKPLVPLAARIAGIEVVASGEPLPSFDVHCPILSLPLAFKTTLETIPSQASYLSPPPERIVHWRTRVAGARGLKVGLAWAGNPKQRNDRNRSIPIEHLKPLLGADGVRFFSLQVGPRSVELAAIKSEAIVDVSEELTDFGETAAAIANLDLVIAADSAVAHLAGAHGKSVWTILSSSADWRWLLDRDDSPWYGSMRLSRQRTLTVWEDVMARVAADLRAAAAHGRDQT